MRNQRTILGAALAVPFLSAAAWAQVVTTSVDLSRYPVGPLPPEFMTSWRTGQGAVGHWQVIENPSANLMDAGNSAKVSSGAWHTLTLRVEGDRLSVSFDGKFLLTHSDRTFAGSGKVALWTKADSVTHFDRSEIPPPHSAAGITRNPGDAHG